MDYRVGVCQYKPRLAETDYNLNRLKSMLDGVEADLIVLPELAVTGYVFNCKAELNAVAEASKEGKTSQFFANLAFKNNTSYVVGFPEKDGVDTNGEPIIYNSSFLVNPDGSYYVYRKIHLFNFETVLFTPGNGGFEVHTASKGVKIGMMICFDWIFPESARTLAIKGAEIICHPSNLVLPWCQQAMITRSIENRVFTATCNRNGKEVNGALEMTFTGQSQITTPQGNVLKRLDIDEETVHIETINPSDASDKMVTGFNHIHNDRRPEKYI